MPVVQQLAETLTKIADSAIAPKLRDKLALHLFDTLGAISIGLELDETRRLAAATADLATPSPRSKPQLGKLPLGSAILQLCAAARATEVDDIHLASCITPSSIIVPTVLMLARQQPSLPSDRFLKACLAGYETIIRFGLAIDGPSVIYKGIWPTYLCTSMGSAATAGALLGLTRPQMEHALAIAAAMAAGANARSDSPTAKWFMAGASAQNGVLAAQGAQQGFQGDLGLLDERWGKLFGLAIDTSALTRAANSYHAQDIAMKAWCGARQAMSALAAFKRLLEETSLKADSLREISIEVPQAYIQMIDRPGLPNSRQESFANVRYQFGLAAFAPDRLYDVPRASLFKDERMQALAKVIRVSHGRDLDSHYPKHWPARVTVTDSAGATHTREILHAPGDAETPLSWQDVSEKFHRVTGRSREDVARLAATCQGLAASDRLPEFLASVDQIIFGAERVA